MSVGPLGMASSVAGTAQSTGSDPDRTQQENSVQQSKVQSDRRAESASGVGETVEDQETTDRDGDGHRLWEQPPEGEDRSDDGQADTPEPPLSKDASGECGANLDLSG